MTKWMLPEQQNDSGAQCGSEQNSQNTFLSKIHEALMARPEEFVNSNKKTKKLTRAPFNSKGRLFS